MQNLVAHSRRQYVGTSRLNIDSLLIRSLRMCPENVDTYPYRRMEKHVKCSAVLRRCYTVAKNLSTCCGQVPHLQLLPGELLHEHLQHLPVEEVLLDVLHDDAVGGDLVVDPVQQDADELPQLGALVGAGLDHGTLLVLVKLELLL